MNDREKVTQRDTYTQTFRYIQTELCTEREKEEDIKREIEDVCIKREKERERERVKWTQKHNGM